MRRPPPYPAEVACFLAPETGTVSISLRRYTNHEGDWTCAAGWHHASVRIGTEPHRREERDGHLVTANLHGPEEYQDDPRWPAECEEGCGYRFVDDDRWQVLIDRLYRLPDGDEVRVLDLPPGAMFDSWWYPEAWKRDGVALTVVLPDGLPWNMDGPATGGGHWTRTGEPPRVTVRPSILSGEAGSGYHGFLTDGVLRGV